MSVVLIPHRGAAARSAPPSATLLGDQRRIPVVIVTADATPGRVRRLVSEGAFACVTKPFDVPEFLRTVEAALAS